MFKIKRKSPDYTNSMRDKYISIKRSIALDELVENKTFFKKIKIE